MVESNQIPVLRPRLPPAERLLPYLRRIDAARIYTNWGPLSSELERRLARTLSLPEGGVISASSGTAALVGAILAAAGRADRTPLAVMPAFTFIATATAAQQCGYQPYFIDVDPENWALQPDEVMRCAALDRVGVVIPVAPFGRPVQQAPWVDFQARTRIPVVIDGAASFDRLIDASERSLGPIPVALSFHATKSFATGEGGCVALHDVTMGERVTQALNFGFRAGRDSEIAHINGKLSEYHAAVGLAALDCWPETHASMRAVADAYREELTGAELAGHLIATPAVASSYVLLLCRSAQESERIQKNLAESHVDFRLWYGGGVHRHRYFAEMPHEALPVTDSIAPRFVGLPLSVDLPRAAVRQVVAALVRGSMPQM